MDLFLTVWSFGTKWNLRSEQSLSLWHFCRHSLVFVLWYCVKVSSCYILSCKGVLLRSCSFSQSPSSLNWKNFLLRPLLLCQVESGWYVQCCSSMEDRWRDGWTQTDISSYKLSFHKRSGSKKQPLGQRPEAGALPDSISWPLNHHSLVSAQWILKSSVQHSTAFTGGNENAIFFPLNCLSVLLVNFWRWSRFESSQIPVRRGTCLVPLKDRFNQKLF